MLANLGVDDAIEVGRELYVNRHLVFLAENIEGCDLRWIDLVVQN